MLKLLSADMLKTTLKICRKQKAIDAEENLQLSAEFWRSMRKIRCI